MIENVENKDILSFEIQTSILDEKKVIGSFNKNSAIIELLNPENKYSYLKGNEISTIKGTFYVDDVTPVQEEIKVKLSCYDLSYKFDTDYDSSKYIFPMTIKQWLISICNNVGVTYAGYDFPNCNQLLEIQPYIPEKSTNRYVVKMIAQSAASWAIIDSDNLILSWFNETQVEVDDWFSQNTENEESNPVNLVVIGRGDVEDNLVYPSRQPDNPKEIRIDSNEILELDRNSMIIPIYKQVEGFKYTVFNLETSGNLSATVGNKIKYLDNSLKSHESYIMGHTLKFLGGDYTIASNWSSKFIAEELDETNTNYEFSETLEQKANRTERLANKLDGIITDVVEEVDNYENRISTVEQTVDKINQTVKDNLDLKRKKVDINQVVIENCALGPLLSLKIYGNDIAPLFPHKKLFPSKQLYPKPSKFYLLVKGEEDQEKLYQLPFTRLYSYENVYDEFNIDNEQNAYVIRRIGVDENNTKYILSKEQRIDLGKVEINLFEGQNILQFLEYNAYLEVEYAIKSELSDTFATKIEMKSSITQTKDEIELSVSKEITDQTNTETLISKINLSPGQIKLEGTVTANENFKILEDGSIEAVNASLSGNIYLPDGGKVIGGDGLLTNLQFSSYGKYNGYDWSGIYAYEDWSGGSARTQRLVCDIPVDVYIPKGFTVTSVKLTYYHIPIYWSYYGSGSTQDFWGSAKQLKLYNGEDSGYEFHMGATEYEVFPADIYAEPMKDAFGADSYTPKNTSGTSPSSKETVELSKLYSFEEGKHYCLVVRTAINYSNMGIVDCLKSCGMGKAIVNVLGYSSYQEEATEEGEINDGTK